MKKRNAATIFAGVVLLALTVCPPAQAHDLWMTMDNYRLDNGAKPAAAIFSSHQFPADAGDYLAPDRLDQVLLVSPTSRQVTMTLTPDGTFGPDRLPEENGTYLAAALPVNGFSTKTTEGYKQGKSKKDLKNAIECRLSRKFAKAVFTVGDPDGQEFSKPLGHAMEIVPMKNPALLKTGDVLPVKVLLEGKPARTLVFGTYAGFTSSPNTFAYTTRTDKEGMAGIKMIHDGVWVLIAKQEEPYPDPAECDKRAWAASLTFEIHPNVE